jgi:hypothetical protein
VQPQVPATEGPETSAIPTPGRETLQKQRHVVQLDALSVVRGGGADLRGGGADLQKQRHVVQLDAFSVVRGGGADLVHHPVSPGAALARTGEGEYTWQVLPAGGCVTTLTHSIKALLRLY